MYLFLVKQTEAFVTMFVIASSDDGEESTHPTCACHIKSADVISNLFIFLDNANAK